VLSYIKVVCTIKQQSDKITDPTYGHKPRLRRKTKECVLGELFFTSTTKT
jgi:hypothetical protein